MDTMQVHRTNPNVTLHVVTHTYVQSEVRALCHVQLHGNSTCTEVSKEIVLERTVSIGYRNRPVTSTNMHMSS